MNYLSKFRSGNINAAGGKPIVEAYKSYKCVTAARFGNNNTAGEAGMHVAFELGNYNTPLTFAGESGTLVAVGLTMDRHPSGHVEVLARGYNRYRVMRSHFLIDVSYHGADQVARDYIVAYKFSTTSAVTEPAFPDSVATTEVWLDMQATRGWVWKRFGMYRLAGARPSRGIIQIKINDLIPLTYTMLGAGTGDIEPNDLQGTIADSTAGPLVTLFLHLCIFKLDANSIPAVFTATNNFSVDIRCTQTVRIEKVQDTDEMIDEGDVV